MVKASCSHVQVDKGMHMDVESPTRCQVQVSTTMTNVGEDMPIWAKATSTVSVKLM